MQDTKRRLTFAIDGHEVSATFSDCGNAAVLGQIKQILLSSFANNLSNESRADILAISAERRDNIDGEGHRAL